MDPSAHAEAFLATVMSGRRTFWLSSGSGALPAPASTGETPKTVQDPGATDGRMAKTSQNDAKVSPH